MPSMWKGKYIYLYIRLASKESHVVFGNVTVVKSPSLEELMNLPPALPQLPKSP